MQFKSEKQRKWMHANKPEMAKEWDKKQDGGLIKVRSHAEGGELIEAEGEEIIINKTMNNAAGLHEEELLALNENPEDYMIVPIEKNSVNRSAIDMLEYINKYGDISMSDARNRGKK